MSVMINRKYGYARVSTEEQSVDNQIDILVKNGIDRRDIYSDVYSGKKSFKNREAFTRLVNIFIEGDELYVYSLDRLGRKMKDIIEIVEKLDSKKVKLKIITMNMDLTSPSGKLILHQFAALAEFELSLMKERQKVGIERAKKEGKYIGRVSTISTLQLEIIRKMYSEGHSLNNISKALGFAKSTIFNIVNYKNCYK